MAEGKATVGDNWQGMDGWKVNASTDDGIYITCQDPSILFAGEIVLPADLQQSSSHPRKGKESIRRKEN